MSNNPTLPSPQSASFAHRDRTADADRIMVLARECLFHADVIAQLALGHGPAGMRMVIPMTGGWVTGSRLEWNRQLSERLYRVI